MPLSHSKTTRPVLPLIIQREHLFKHLDEALNLPLTWVSAPAGAGKTTLLASYLESRSRSSIWYRIDERDRDIPTFLNFLGRAGRFLPETAQKTQVTSSPAPHASTNNPRSWFESYYATLPRDTVIVFDDFDEIAEAKLFEEALLQAVIALPADISIVITSRQTAPQRFTRFKANRQMAELFWTDLQLRQEETEEILAVHNGALPADAVAAIHKECNGWAAGVALLSLHNAAGEKDPIPKTGHLNRKAIFDYFASEIFANFSREDRAFMLRTAYLPIMTSDLARSISGERDSGVILGRLHARGYFTECLGSQGDIYRYHPLFRAFLLQAAQDTLTPKEVGALQYVAARLLEEDGSVGDAIEVAGSSGNWELLLGIIERNSALYIGTGRTESVRVWLGCIPQTVAEASPVWQYWQGCCALSDSSGEATAHFTRAFKLSEGRDPDLTLLAWCGAVRAIITNRDDFSALDDWIFWLNSYLLTQTLPSLPALEEDITISMTWALICRQPHHPDLGNWLERMHRLTVQGNRHQPLKAQIVAANYYCLIGDMVELDIALEGIRKLTSTESSEPLTLMAIWLLGVACAWQNTDADGARRKAAEGLAMAEGVGCHAFDHLFHALCAYGYLLDRETRLAGAALEDMIGSLHARNHLAFALNHHLQSWRALLDGDTYAAISNSSQAVRFAQQTGMVFAEIQCRLVHARVLFEIRDHLDAQKELATAATLAEKGRSPLLQCMCDLLAALMALDAGELEDFRQCATRGFGAMREQGYLSLLWWWVPNDMSRLCGAALDEGIETGFIMGLIRRHGLAPPQQGLISDQWPWPLKVFTMGRFDVIAEGLPLAFSGKSQAKPLALLQAIISLGSRGVAQEQLIECLWPDADGDVGHQSFATTLHRLRKLIGNEQVIVLQGGKVTLSPHYCWVDVWAFERVASRLLENRPMAAECHDTMFRQTERVLSLYHGPFLGEDATHAWATPMRERLRNRMLRVVQKVGAHMEEVSPEQATCIYERGIETDQFIEDFYQGLMRCYAKQDKKGEVHSIYQKCGKILENIGTKPSLKTEILYRDIFATH